MERLTYVLDTFDRVVVSFSGGKDSTVCLNLAIEAARVHGRLPLEVFTFDEEAIPPETVEYMARVAQLETVRFRWYCVPIQHRNACSTTEPYWYPWAPEDRAKWVRPLPAGAITEFPGFTRAGIADQVGVLYPPTCGTVANVMGIRTDESLTRYRSIAAKAGRLAYLSQGPSRHVTNVSPIYDWSMEDVWMAPSRFGWDYNRAYDVMDACGMARDKQRCAPPFGEQPIRGLYTFKRCWPELWARMVDRVPGAATAARYANTELYGYGVQEEDLPPGQTWRSWTLSLTRSLQPSSRREVAEAIRAGVVAHQNRAGPVAIPDADPHPISGFCWKTLCIVAQAGGNKFDRQGQKMKNAALAERRKRGITS